MAPFHLHYLFIIYTSDLPPPSAPVQVMAYADDITITSSHTAKKYIQPYLHKVFARTKQNNLILNPDKTTCTLFTPCRIYEQSGPKQQRTTYGNAPKCFGLTLDQQLTYSRTLLELCQFSIPWLEPLIESSILLPLVSVDLEYHNNIIIIYNICIAPYNTIL